MHAQRFLIHRCVAQDYNARTYVASTINSALNTSLTPGEVIAVSAEEAVGVSTMFGKYAAIPGNPEVGTLAYKSASHTFMLQDLLIA